MNMVEGPGGLSFIHLDKPRCRARLTSHGAHLCEWTPAGQSSPVVFLSPRAVFARDKAIRGGVPVCFPWFGPHPTDPNKPQHGFAHPASDHITCDRDDTDAESDNGHDPEPSLLPKRQRYDHRS